MNITIVLTVIAVMVAVGLVLKGIIAMALISYFKKNPIKLLIFSY